MAPYGDLFLTDSSSDGDGDAMLVTLLGSKIAVTFATGAVAVGGLGAAAYAVSAGADTAQHSIGGAPAGKSGAAHGKNPDQKNNSHARDADPSDAPASTPVGPDATGPAAFGLCTAYQHSKGHGNAGGKSVAMRNLAAAAGGSDKVAAYCATVTHPGGKPTSLPSHSGGKPTSVPSHPGGRPTSVPSHSGGRPTSVPSHSGGRPTSMPSEASGHGPSHR